MGLLKKFERSSKKRLMWALAKLLKAKPLDAGYFREHAFGKVLIIRQHNQMGDMILAIPAFRAVRQTYENAKIGVISSTLNRGVLINNPYVDKLFLYDKKNPISLLPLIRDIRRERYDLVIVLHTVSFSFTSVALAVLSRAKIRIGSTSRELGDSLSGSYLSLTLPLPSDEELERMTETEHNLFPLGAIGVVTNDLSPLIVPSQANESWAAEFDRGHWRSDSIRLAVHPGAGKAENIWPPQRHAEVVNRLGELTDISVIVVEGPRDAGSVADFRGACAHDVSVVRERSIGDVAALLRRADLVICNDTGIMHVAAAVGATTLAVFGPTDPARWAPQAEGLHVVRSQDGNLSTVTPDMVTRRATQILGL
jgi:heptosyltransferase-2